MASSQDPLEIDTSKELCKLKTAADSFLSLFLHLKNGNSNYTHVTDYLTVNNMSSRVKLRVLRA